MFTLYFDYFVISVISRFDFEGWNWVLMGSVPGICILFTFIIFNIFYAMPYLLKSRNIKHFGF